VGEGKGAGADGIAGGQNVSTPSINYSLRHCSQLNEFAWSSLNRHLKKVLTSDRLNCGLIRLATTVDF
jgi:hypothetical protein